jgi:hypothetical protein
MDEKIYRFLVYLMQYKNGISIKEIKQSPPYGLFIDQIDLDMTVTAAVTKGGAEYTDESRKSIKVSDVGFIFVDNFKKHIDSEEQKSDKEKERQERKDKADVLDLQIKEWQIKTKYLPYIVSFLALGVSIASYFKPEKKQQDLQQVQQQIQELQDRVQLQDSLFRVDSLPKKYK